MSWNPGDKVQIHEYSSGQWRDAILNRRCTYQPDYGGIWWDYYFDPLPKIDTVTGISPSTGGAIPERCIRARRENL